ncbi:MAG: metallophosphoesterase, partial [Rubrivivax sp.]
MEYDVIGDIHGHADKLKALLRRMGYAERRGRWQPPAGHQTIFVGDLIDRGPEQAAVVALVRAMVDAGDAHAVLGNHELNALGFAQPDPDRPGGQYLRPHSAKNVEQHEAFLHQVEFGSGEHRAMLDWFRTLPPSLELDGIRVVHAWWHPPYVDAMARRLNGKPIDDAFLVDAFRSGSHEWTAMEGLTKGLELRLP